MEVAQPRIPCAKLAARVGREDFSNEFLMAGRLGYYLYTLKTGEVQAVTAWNVCARRRMA